MEEPPWMTTRARLCLAVRYTDHRLQSRRQPRRRAAGRRVPFPWPLLLPSSPPPPGCFPGTQAPEGPAA